MQAQSLLLVGPEQLAWTAVDLAEPGPDELLVETLAGAISIGTELPHYLGTSRGIAKRYPAMTGYESVARVLVCGTEVTDVKPGDHIVSFYGHRTHAIIPATKAIPVPDADQSFRPLPSNAFSKPRVLIGEEPVLSYEYVYAWGSRGRFGKRIRSSCERAKRRRSTAACPVASAS